MTEQERYSQTIKSNLSDVAKLEALAEESAELTQASLKLIRALGNGNPTPKSVEECQQNLREEIADILMVLDVMDITLPNIVCNSKWQRWSERILS